MKPLYHRAFPTANLRKKEEDKMLINPCTAMSEMERRYEFVSEGAQTARWLKRFAMARFHIYRGHLLQATGDALNALGAWLVQKGQLDSAHS
jgi:hypothetical protein